MCVAWFLMSVDKAEQAPPHGIHTAVNEGRGLNSWGVWPPWLVPVMKRHPEQQARGMDWMCPEWGGCSKRMASVVPTESRWCGGERASHAALWARASQQTCKRKVCDNNSAHVWVLPYVTSDFQNNEEAYRSYYDEIEVFNSAGIHYKSAYQARNRSMIDRSDLVVFFVTRKNGGAYQALQYAFQRGKTCLNLYNTKEDGL